MSSTMTVRNPKMFALLFALAGCNPCPGECEDNPPGLEGGCCPCGLGLECLNGACTTCGADGELCCNELFCDSGLSCVFPTMGEPTCEPCGQLGGACCESDTTAFCASGSTCVDDRCIDADDACDIPPGPGIAVGVIDENDCAVRIIAIDTNTFENAVPCARTMLEPGEQVYEVENPVMQDWDMCVTRGSTGSRSVTVSTFEEAAARDCACEGDLRCTPWFGDC